LPKESLAEGMPAIKLNDAFPFAKKLSPRSRSAFEKTQWEVLITALGQGM
jgi:hypothetical protein